MGYAIIGIILGYFLGIIIKVNPLQTGFIGAMLGIIAYLIVSRIKRNTNEVP